MSVCVCVCVCVWSWQHTVICECECVCVVLANPTCQRVTSLPLVTLIFGITVGNGANPVEVHEGVCERGVEVWVWV